MNQVLRRSDRGRCDVLEGVAVVVTHDHAQHVLGLRRLEFRLEPIELILRNGSVGTGYLVAGVETEHTQVRSDVGLPVRLLLVDVLLREAVTDWAWGCRRVQVCLHEPNLVELLAARVRGDRVHAVRHSGGRANSEDHLLERAGVLRPPVDHLVGSSWPL